MDAKGFLCGSSIIVVFLAIGIVATRLHNPRLLALIAGLMVGGLLGFFLAIFWLLFTGNLMFGEDEYERMKAAERAGLLIIGSTAMIGAILGFVQSLFPSRKGNKRHEVNSK